MERISRPHNISHTTMHDELLRLSINCKFKMECFVEHFNKFDKNGYLPDKKNN